MIGQAILVLGGLGLGFGILLSFASRKFAVVVDPKEEKILEVLPGSNCGACGFPGCQGLAEALAKGKTEATSCVAGGAEVTKKVAKILGVEIEPKTELVAFVACRAGIKQAKKKFKYRGLNNCQADALLFTGDKSCVYGCLGLGSCAKVCPFDAISITAEGLAVIDPKKCKSCQKCVKACP
ncbi:electron transporter RnfB, partial [Candidatus Uhrbacteria bacterium CG_4_9_14_3_um_filter_50_9]